MALTVGNIITSARDLLSDPVNTRWSETEMIQWFNDAIRQAIIIKPDANPITEEFVCVAGHKQAWTTLAQPLVLLLDVIANTTTGGGTSVTAITLVDRNFLDLENQTWRTDTPSTTLQYYMYDTRQRDVFYVYPPATAATTFEMAYAGIPTAVTVIGDPIGIQDIYGPALINYLLWRAYSKDSDFSGNMQLAAGYYSAFVQSLTGKMLAEQSQAPDRKVPIPVIAEVE